MNPIDMAMQECLNTIAQLQARVINLAVENAGLKAALEAAQQTKKPADNDDH